MAMRVELSVKNAKICATMEAGNEEVRCTLEAESNQSNYRLITFRSTGTQSSAINSPSDDGDAMEDVIMTDPGGSEMSYEDELVRAMNRLSLYEHNRP